MKVIFVELALLAVWLISGCSAQQAYDTAQGWQRNQRNKHSDKADFDRCINQTRTTYQSYKRQSEPQQR
jgi:hypothetical protein